MGEREEGGDWVAPKLPKSPPPSSENTRRTMRANKGRETKPERKLRAGLRDIGLTGYRLNVKGLPGRPDLAFTRHKVAVFVHGCFWHRCPTCRPPMPKHNREFWRLKFRLNRERDERKRRELGLLGWDVVEIWECQLRENPGECVRFVARLIARAQDEGVGA
jgi:DNA mismatch endonuclease (patch repair protein)